MKLSKLFAATSLAAAAFMALAPAVHARELKLAVGFPQGTAAYAGLEAFGKALKEKSGGELEVKVFPLSLLNLPQMLNGVRDGVVDIGFVLPPCFPLTCRKLIWPSTWPCSAPIRGSWQAP